ncbi:tail fiber domain-containing protein [Pluralibacter gergoviae]|nr:tail fiber domain-containing protein [Pluralibacter gergoviae]
MATISDQLAADIQTAFSKTFTDLANQDSFFFGPSGDVTLTKPDGTTATIKSWSYLLSTLNGMGSTATINTWEKDQAFSGSVTLSGDNSMFLMGKDSDIGIVKKSGYGSKIVMAKGKQIVFATSPNAKVGVSDTVTDVARIYDNGDISVGGVFAGYVELNSATPYIDFHYNKSSADFTHRIIAKDQDYLVFAQCGLSVDKNVWVSGNLTCNWNLRSNSVIIGQPGADPNGGNGAILQTPWYVGQFNGRGADSNGLAGVGLWFEENVGYNHRAVLRVQGYGAPIRYWQFLSDGNIYGPNGVLTYNGTSDARYKKQIKPTDGQQSLENIMKMGLVTFVYNDDEQERVRRGVIAQQVQEIDPQYVKEVVMSVGVGPETPAENVKTTSRLTLDNNVLLMDAISAIQVLARRVEELEKRNL